MVHVRKLEGKTYSLIVSGKLWRNSLIMQDRETGTLFSHVTGQGLHGKLAGQHFETLPSVQTTWAKWYAAHPKTLVLKKDGKLSASRYQKYFDDPERMGIIRTGLQLKKLPGKTMVHGIQQQGHALAVPDSKLVLGTPLRASLGKAAIVISRDADGGVRAHLTNADGDVGGELPVRQSYWFAWLSFFPNTELM